MTKREIAIADFIFLGLCLGATVVSCSLITWVVAWILSIPFNFGLALTAILTTTFLAAWVQISLLPENPLAASLKGMGMEEEPEEEENNQSTDENPKGE